MELKKITLDHINTVRFIFNPKSLDFEDKMINYNPIFDLPKDRKKWLTYITLAYDAHSEVRRNNSEYMQRKWISSQIAGFKTDKNGHYSTEVEDKLIGKDSIFNKAVSEFCKLAHKKDYELYELLIEKFNLEIENYQISKKPLIKKDRQNIQGMKDDISKLEVKIFGGEESVELKDNLYSHLLDFLLEKYSLGISVHKNSDKSLSADDRKNLQDMKDDIADLENKIFSDDSSLDLRKALYYGTDISKLRIRAEDRVNNIEEDNMEPWNPYPGYVTGKLKFVGDRVPIE